MNGKSLFGMAAAMLAVWFALCGSSPALADADFDGCTFYTRLKVSGGGQSGPAIDVGFMPKGTTSVDAKYRVHDTSGNSCLFCSRNSSSADKGPHFTFFTSVSGKPRWDYNATMQDSGLSQSLNPNYRLMIENGTATLYTTLDRAPLKTVTASASTFAETHPMYLFSSYTKSGTTIGGFDNGGRIYFYYLKLYDGPIADGKLLHHYVPCKTSGGNVGVADIVEEKVFLPMRNASNLTVDENDSLGGVRPTLNASSFGAYATFMVSGYDGSEKLEEFPVLVRLSEARLSGFSYDSCAADGSDIRFADADGHLIAHEIDTWDPSGESLIWVNIPKLESGTAFKMYMGGDGSAPTLPASSVWRRAGYHLVNHNNVIASTVGMDSAGSGLVGAAYNGGLVASTLAGAPLGKVDDQTNNHGWTVANDAKWTAHGGQVTISTWSYRTDVGDSTSRELMGVKGVYHLVNQTPKDGKCQLYYGSTKIVEAVMPVAAGNWMQITATLNGTDARAYQNGVLLGSGTSTAIANVTEKLSCGSEYSGNSRNKGYFDEWRLRWGVSSADWVKAEYDTVMKNDFLAGYMGDPPVPDDWEYSCLISLNDGMKTALGSGEERDFPVLVRLSESGISGFKYSDFKEADYSDLIFVGQDGKFLDYEIDTWDAGGTSLVWVRVPSFTAASAITCRYGGPKYSHNASKTWKKFVAVVHCGNSIKDSSARNFTVTANATVATDVGVVGGGVSKAANNSIGLNIASPSDALTSSGMFSVMAWYKRDGNGGNNNNGTHILSGSRKGFGNGSGYLVLQEQGKYISVAAYNSHSWTSGAYKLEDKVWGHVAFTYEKGVKLISYFNGAKDQEKASPGALESTAAQAPNWTFGSYANTASADSFKGEMDEIRVYDGVASAAWIAADYYQMMNADAFVYDEVEQPDPEQPGLANVRLSVNDAGDIVVVGAVTRHDGEVRITFSSEGELPIVVSLGQVAAGENFERVVGEDDGLIRFTEYTVSVSASNGEKVSQKTFPERVKYGKVRPSDRYEFSVTPSAAVKDRLASDIYADYPVLVRVPSEALQVMVTGREMKVTDESGTELPWELETIDGDGRALIWVKVPALTASTKLTVCTGGGDNPDNDPTEVWSDYVGVWHLDEAKATTMPNSYGEYTNSTSTVGINGNLAKYSIANEPGIVGKAFRVNDVTTSQRGNFNYGGVWVPGTSALKLGQNFTISGWFKMAANAFYYDHIFYKRASSNNGTAPTGAFAIEVSAMNKTTFIIDARGVNTFTSSKSVTNADPFSDWVYLTFVYNGTTCSIYSNGAKAGDVTISAVTDNDAALTFGNNCNIANGSVGDAAWCGWIDEVRLASGSRTAQRIAMDYLVVTDAGFFDYTDPHLVDPTAPVLLVPEIVCNEDGTFTVTEVIDGNMPEEGSVEIFYGGTRIPMSTEDTAVPAIYTAAITPVAENVTEILEVRARSASGFVYVVKSSGFYNGDLKIEKIRDASEKGLSNGVWRIIRADTAYDLNVSLSVLDTSTATAGTDYVEFPLTTVIPDGTNSVDVMVTPIVNLECDNDTWVDLAITNGAYRIDPEKFAARCTIVNYEIPTGGNIWCATAPGKASVASNWTSGVVPDELSSVMFDGDVSSANCEWDIGAPHRLKNWTQLANYGGTVTIATTFDGSFPKFTVDGDMLVLGGRVCHKPHDSSHKVDFYRLSLDIGGMLVVGKGASISARGLGSYGPRAEGQSCYGGGYDGASSWGSLTEPNAVGSSANDNGTYTCFGGGAIWIEAAGLVSVDGSISANGIMANGAWDTHAGSGGSVYLKCSGLTGSGTVSANCENTKRSSNSRSGAGGRVSVLLTGSELTDFKYTQFDARAGWTSYGNHGGTGTVLVRSPSKPNGILYLRDAEQKYDQYGYRISSLSGRLTDIPKDQNWVLDGIVFGHNAVLRIPLNTSLSLPNGLLSVSSDAADINCGIIVDNGSLILPAGDQIMSGKWTLTSRNEGNVTTVRGDLVMKSGANIGSIVLYAGRTDDSTSLPLYGKSRLRIEGDLTVEEGATLVARRCGLKKYSNSLNSGHKGVLQGHTHGGRVFNYKSKDAQLRMYTAYDSVFAPSLPGNAVPWPNGQSAEESGGVISLDIGGHFQMDGKADVSGNLDTYVPGANCSGGTGGSIDITAGSIAGRGSFRADGGVKQVICGPGGRIAIKLTEEGADFSAFKGVISASGRVNGNDYSNASSAGTVFLKTGDDTENGGTIRIAMSSGNWNINNPSSTELLSIGYGGDTAEEYKELGLEIADFGFGAVNADLKMSWAKFVGRNTRLDLEGHMLTVCRAWINGSKVPVGTYQSGDEPFGGMLVDSVGNGGLRVTGYGLWVFIQ